MNPPTYYAAHLVRGGTVTENTAWIGRCGMTDCDYWADHPTNLQTVTDAVAGHRYYEHGIDADHDDEGPQPGPAAGEGDAAEHDISPGVLTFGREGTPPGYGDPGAPLVQRVSDAHLAANDEALARRMVRGRTAMERRGVERQQDPIDRPSPYPRAD